VKCNKKSEKPLVMLEFLELLGRLLFFVFWVDFVYEKG